MRSSEIYTKLFEDYLSLRRGDIVCFGDKKEEHVVLSVQVEKLEGETLLFITTDKGHLRVSSNLQPLSLTTNGRILLSPLKDLEIT